MVAILSDETFSVQLLNPLDRVVLTDATDNNIREDTPDTPGGAETDISVDLQDPLETQALLRFNNISIPDGATLVSAELKVFTNSSSDGTVSAYRMLQTWDDNSTWNSFGNDGIQPNDTEAATTASFTIPEPSDETLLTLDVTSDVQFWLNNPAQNQGWVFINDSGDGWDFDSSETVNNPPQLVLNFSSNAPTLGDDNLTGTAGDDLIQALAGNDTVGGGDGNDTLKGGKGNDELNGEDGDDLLRGQGGDDVLNGGDGNDNVGGGADNDTVTGGAGNDTVTGFNGDDILIGVDPSADNPGSGEVDRLQGGEGADTFVLGEERNPYYLGGNADDYALVQTFDPNVDIIQLPSGPSYNYTLNSVGSNTEILSNSDRVGLVIGVSLTNFDSGFSFVGGR